MIIEIGNCVDERNKINKSFTSRYDYTGYIKEPSSVIDPSILIEADIAKIAGCNYAYIPQFRRYYYITNIVSATNTTCTIKLHVDVLMSYKNQLMDCYGYVDRQEDICSVMIADPEKLKQINPTISTVPFTVPTAAEGYTYCLITTKSV